MSDHSIVVLCIDDDASALQVLEAAAHIAGFEYHGTSDPVEGLRIARELGRMSSFQMS